MQKHKNILKGTAMQEMVRSMKVTSPTTTAISTY